MNAIQRFDVSLPRDLAEEVERRVRSGEYRTASDVLIAGLTTLLDRDSAMESWLRHDVLAGHAEHEANPSAAVPAAELLGRIKARWASRG